MVQEICVIMMLFHFVKEIAGDVWAPIPRCLHQILQCYNTKTSQILTAIMMMRTTLRYTLRKNGIIWEFFPNVTPTPLFGNPLFKMK